MIKTIEHATKYALRRDDKTGKMFYDYVVNKDIKFNFSMLCEVGVPFQAWFINALKRNKIERIAVETKQDYFEIDETFLHLYINNGFNDNLKGE